MANVTEQLTPELINYLHQIIPEETPVQKQLRRETQKMVDVAIMQISPEQAQFMAWLVQLTGARMALEIGTFTGYSALAVAQAMPGDGRVVCCDVNKEWTDVAQRFWAQAGVSHKISLHLQEANKTLDELIAGGRSGTFDFAFIDADKANYPDYYEKALHLLRVNGVIAIDNVFMHGNVIDPNVQTEAIKGVRAINDIVKHDARVSHSTVTIGDGLTLVRKLR